MYNGASIRLSVDIAAESWASQKGVCDMFKGLKEYTCQARILYLSFKYEEEIKASPHKQKMREFITTRNTL